MKFIAAIKALGPGQLLVSPAERRYEAIAGRLHDVETGKMLLMIDLPAVDNWYVIDKPRPRVKFADAISAAALEGAMIKSLVNRYTYVFRDGVPVICGGSCVALEIEELRGDWEIIEAEGGK